MPTVNDLPIFTQRRLAQRSGAFGFKERTVQADFVEATTVSGKEFTIISDGVSYDLTTPLVNLAQQQALVNVFESDLTIPGAPSDIDDITAQNLALRLAEEMGVESIAITGIFPD